MYEFFLTQRPDGMDIAECYDGDELIKVTSRGSVCSDMARELMARRYPDGPWQAFGVPRQLRLSGPSIYTSAKATLSDTERGFQRRRWKAFGGGADGQACALCGQSEFIFKGRCIDCGGYSDNSPARRVP